MLVTREGYGGGNGSVDADNEDGDGNCRWYWWILDRGFSITFLGLEKTLGSDDDQRPIYNIEDRIPESVGSLGQ